MRTKAVEPTVGAALCGRPSAELKIAKFNAGAATEGRPYNCALKIILLAALFLFAPTVIVGQDSRPAELTLKDIKGRYIRLRDYRGKVVLINFWATWCPPCRAEIPDLIKLQREYRSRGLRVIGVTYPPQRLATVRRFVRKAKVNYPIALGTEETMSIFTSGEILPVTIVIGADGRVRDIIKGILLPEEFEQKIKPLLN